MTATNTKARNNARTIALASIAAQSMSEALSRQAVIATIGVALGKAPDDKETEAARAEFIIGKVAMKVKGKLSNDQRLAKARIIVLNYASAPKDGVEARPLRKGQTGRRSPDEQRAYQAAKEQFSKILAELKIGGAKTQDESNAPKKVAGRPAGGGKGKTTAKRIPKDVAAAMVAMTTSPAKMTREMATTHIATQVANLMAFINKHAGIVPLSFSEPLTTCKASLNKAMNDEQEAKASLNF